MRSATPRPSVATDTVEFESVPVDFFPPGTLVAARYEIIEPLGSGGYAAVYRAFDRQLKCEVALKILRRERTSPAAITRLRREAVLLTRMGRPPEAADAARRGWEYAQVDRKSSIIARAHTDIVRQRFIQIAGGKD